VSVPGTAVGPGLRTLARRLLPGRMLGLLRSVKTRATVRGYPAREVTHTYGGFPLRVWLTDPLAEGWYDRDWARLRPSFPEDHCRLFVREGDASGAVHG
jgi:hypothetical protein